MALTAKEFEETLTSIYSAFLISDIQLSGLKYFELKSGKMIRVNMSGAATCLEER
jgi:hypothetical protein